MVTLGISLAAAVSGCSPLAESPEENLLRARCAHCHSYDNALRKRKSVGGWERTIWAMRQRGAELTDQEAERLVRYLARERSP